MQTRPHNPLLLRAILFITLAVTTPSIALLTIDGGDPPIPPVTDLPDPNEDPNNAPIQDPNASPEPLDDPKLWALACAAIDAERIHNRHDLLAADVITAKNAEAMRKSFAQKNASTIESRSDLFDKLNKIRRSGMSVEFEKCGAAVHALTEPQYQQLLVRYKNEPRAIRQFTIARDHFLELGPKSIRGWDYANYIAVCRKAHMAGYLTEEEAWEKIMPVAEELQEICDSWQDLADNYLIGLRFCSYEPTKTNDRLFEDAVQRLLDMKSSPWNRLPWNTVLDKTKLAKEKYPTEPPSQHAAG